MINLFKGGRVDVIGFILDMLSLMCVWDIPNLEDIE